MFDNLKQRGLSTAEISGIVALSSALLFFALGMPFAALIALLLFVGACLVAPFLPRSSFFLPVRSRLASPSVLISFDDGPHPDSTPLLLDLLARHGLKALFFVVGKKAAAHPELISAIIEQGHAVGNHSYRHDYLLMLRRPQTVARDIADCQQTLAEAGVSARFFRPPVGICGPRLAAALAPHGLRCVSFSCRAMDLGNRRVAGLAAAILRKLRPGDIIMLHDLPPADAAQGEQWLREIDLLFQGVTQKFQVAGIEALAGGKQD